MKEYSVEIYEWSGTSWEPYVAEDVQVQFYMMSPYVLKTLSTNQKVHCLITASKLDIISLSLIIFSNHLFKQGLYYTAFKVPDVYGVFQFKVEYQRLGYTSLSLSKQVPLCWSALYNLSVPCYSIPGSSFNHHGFSHGQTLKWKWNGMNNVTFVFTTTFSWCKRYKLLSQVVSWSRLTNNASISRVVK